MKKRQTRSPRSPRKSASRANPSTDALDPHAYARQVAGRKIPACEWVRAACKRHLRDLERGIRADFPYRFDQTRADRAIRFIENLPHTKGHWAAEGERLRLEPWQRFIVGSLFGWIEKTTGYYRFREAYIEVPRKNGKSILAAGIGLFKFAADGEFGAEVYSGATSEKQAWEVFRPARQMAERTGQMCTAFGIQVHAKALSIPRNGSRFEPVIGKPGDGASPSCAIVDEYHEHQSDVLAETMRTGMAARRNPLLFKITTAGSDRSSPCYADHLDAQKLLKGRIRNERLFAIIYTVDKEDRWRSGEALRMANPNLGVSIDPGKLEDDQADAAQLARKQNAFKTKHLNVWVNADVAWLSALAWDRCCDRSLKLANFAGQECVIGVDLASRVDLAAKVYVFPRIVDDRQHFYVFSQHYLNSARVDETENAHYASWNATGKLTVTEGNVTDYNRIGLDLIEDAKRFVIRELAHDPYHAAALIQFVQAMPEWPYEITPVEFRQVVQTMSPAMKELEGMVVDRRLHHDGNPVLAWEIGNVVCHRDAKENIFPRKQRPENKIDGAVALIMALGRAIIQPGGGSVYETQGLTTL